MSKSKKHKKEKRRKDKKEKKKHKKHSKSKSPPPVLPSSAEVEPIVGPAPPAAPTPSMAPMTKEQWDAKQSQIRRVLDPETGRMRYAQHWNP